MDASVDREEAVVGLPEDKVERVEFGRAVKLDLSTPEREYAELMYPVSQAFDHGDLACHTPSTTIQSWHLLSADVPITGLTPKRLFLLYFVT